MIVGTMEPGRLARFEFPQPKQFDDTFVVQGTWELAGVGPASLLPPALHPTLPLLISVVAIEGHAQVRLSCRHGARARALVIAASNDVRFDGTRLEIGSDVVLSIGELVRPLGPADVQYVTSLWPVDVEGRGMRLVQQELDVEPKHVARHAATIEQWPDEWPTPATLVGVSLAQASVALPMPRFMARPDVLAFEGSETV
jgi:hypothetical protein